MIQRSQNKKRVVYVLSKVEKAVAFEWIVEEFKAKPIELVFIILHDNFDTALASFLKSNQTKLYQFELKGKKYFPILWLKVLVLLAKLKPNVIHTHLFEGSLIGLSAAKFIGIKKRIYTRHHSTYHHEYFPKAIKYDKLINFLSTNIIAISSNVKDVLIKKENVAPQKINLIEHGFCLENFENVSEDRVNLVREKHKLPVEKTVIATISRYFELKGIEYVIRAFCQIIEQHPNVHLLLANSGGKYETVIQKELKNLPEGSYTEIRFEEDLFALYQLIDIYCHVPINSKIEAFGQTYIEALAAGVPSIFTLSGIAKDFIVDKENALVVPMKNSEKIMESIRRILIEEALRDKLIKNGKESVKRFQLQNMTDQLFEMYKK